MYVMLNKHAIDIRCIINLVLQVILRQFQVAFAVFDHGYPLEHQLTVIEFVRLRIRHAHYIIQYYIVL